MRTPRVCCKRSAAGRTAQLIFSDVLPRGSRYADLVRDEHGNEQERLSLMQAHRADVAAKIVELQGNLRLIDRKIDVYQGRLAAGDADRFWAPPPPTQSPVNDPLRASPRGIWLGKSWCRVAPVYLTPGGRGGRAASSGRRTVGTASAAAARGRRRRRTPRVRTGRALA